MGACVCVCFNNPYNGKHHNIETASNTELPRINLLCKYASCCQQRCVDSKTRKSIRVSHRVVVVAVDVSFDLVERLATQHTLCTSTATDPLALTINQGWLEQSLTPHSTQYRSFRRWSSQPITWLILTNKTVQKNTDKQTQYKSEKVDNLKYSKTKLPWSSCLLQSTEHQPDGVGMEKQDE